MNRTIKDATVKRFHYGSNEQLRVHLSGFLNAYNAELFPTSIRADAFAWANNLLGRIGYVLAPIAVGWAAEHSSWSVAVSATGIFPVIALGIILARFPETKGKELEETALS